MKLYDELTKQDIILKKNSVVNIYLCGPTVYDELHIGNIRPVIMIDILIRMLKYHNYKVKYVQNITDIDDKIINKAIEKKVSEKKLSENYLNKYMEVLLKINVLIPDSMPKVSTNMPIIIELISKLVKNNSAYVKNGNVYFNVSKFNNIYGQLSNRNHTSQIAGSRVQVNDQKQNPEDFVIWKKTQSGISWESPWSKGRPGWHTECVALINHFFDTAQVPPLTIHAGGVDLKFPHHENERVQYYALKGCELAKVWMHNGHLNIDNNKMSKSLNNFVTISSFIKKYNSNTLKLIFLQVGFSKPLNFSNNLLTQILKIEAKLTNISKLIRKFITLNNIKFHTIKFGQRHDTPKLNEFISSLCDKLDVTMSFKCLIEQMGKINAVVKQSIKKESKSLCSSNDIFMLISEFLTMLKLFGLNYNLTPWTSEELGIYNKWVNAVRDRKFDTSDKLRKILYEKGLI